MPLELDWKELLPGMDDETPHEVVVIDGVGGEATKELSELTDHQLKEKIQRLMSNMGDGLVRNLSNKGAKLREHLRQCQGELDRRELVRSHKGFDEFERAEQFRSPESVSHDGPGPIFTKSEPRSHSSFSSRILQKLENKTGGAFEDDLKFYRQDKFKSLREIGGQMHDGKPQSRMASQPAKIPVIESSSISISHLGRKISSHSPKRRRTYDSEDPSRLEKIQHVVLLDEEDVQPTKSIHVHNPDEWKECKVYYPSRNDPGSIELSYLDIKCLEPKSYLSSSIINFYIRYLQRPVSPLGRPRGEYYFFNTYFYRKLEEAVSCKGDRSACFLKLRRWWKGVNIFQKAYIFLPIHGNLHWSLVIICIPAKEDELGPIILHLDSLGMHTSKIILDVIDCYLKEEWSYIKQNNPPPDVPISERIWKNLPCRIEKKTMKVPQQKNEYDCGLFVLYFMERFIEEAPERLRMKDLAMFGSKWFKPEDASDLRVRIRALLIEEFENARLDNGSAESPVPSSGSENEVELQCFCCVN